MKIDYFPYQLKTLKQVREGALLKFSFEEGLIGYADCHPWPSLGDLELSDQLKKLSHNELTYLTKRSLDLARIDAQARQNKMSLFNHLTIPTSHKLMLDLLDWKEKEIEQAIDEGFNLIKIKLGRQIEREIEVLDRLLRYVKNKPLKFVFDFNESLTPLQFENFLHVIPLEKMDCCEDPFPFNPLLWEEIQEKYAICLACDRAALRALDFPKSAAILVIKPAIQESTPFLQKLKDTRKWMFTSYLDHPLGIMSAAYVAADAYSRFPNRARTCGLLSYDVYLSNHFSELMKRKGPNLCPTEGTGFGFDPLLASLPWKRLGH